MGQGRAGKPGGAFGGRALAELVDFGTNSRFGFADFFGDLQKDEPLFAAHRLINVPRLHKTPRNLSGLAAT